MYREAIIFQATPILLVNEIFQCNVRPVRSNLVAKIRVCLADLTKDIKNNYDHRPWALYLNFSRITLGKVFLDLYKLQEKFTGKFYGSFV